MKNKKIKDFIEWLACLILIVGLAVGGWLAVGLVIISLWWLVIKQ